MQYTCETGSSGMIVRQRVFYGSGYFNELACTMIDLHDDEFDKSFQESQKTYWRGRWKEINKVVADHLLKDPGAKAVVQTVLFDDEIKSGKRDDSRNTFFLVSALFVDMADQHNAKRLGCDMHNGWGPGPTAMKDVDYMLLDGCNWAKPGVVIPLGLAENTKPKFSGAIGAHRQAA